MSANMRKLEAMASDLLGRNEADWGSDRQIRAENRFWRAAEKALGGGFPPEFDVWCLKATHSEITSEVLRLCRAKLGEQ